jgi:hypothetical protein
MFEKKCQFFVSQIKKGLIQVPFSYQQFFMANFGAGNEGGTHDTRMTRRIRVFGKW